MLKYPLITLLGNKQKGEHQLKSLLDAFHAQKEAAGTKGMKNYWRLYAGYYAGNCVVSDIP